MPAITKRQHGRVARVTVVSALTVGVIWWLRTRPPGPLVEVVTLGGSGPRVISESLSDPFGVAVDDEGNVFVSDGLGGKVFRLSPDGKPQTVASGLNMPSALAFDRDGTLIVANTGDHTILRIDPVTGKTSLLAGKKDVSGDADGPVTEATFNGPIGVAVSTDGTVLIADTYNHRIRAISRDGLVWTLAGVGKPGFRDGSGTEALFDTPCGVVATDDGDVFVADTGNHRVRRIGKDSMVSSLAGTGAAASVDGDPSEAAFDEPTAIALRRDGALFVADAGSSKIRVITRKELPRVSTVAGGIPNGLVDGGIEGARLNRPVGIAISLNDLIVFADSGNGLVRALLPRGERTGRISKSEDGLLSSAEIRKAVTPRWPFDPPDRRREIAGTFGEIRGEALPDHETWFHSGLDIPGGYGETVRALFEERVTRPLAVEGVGSLRERIRLPLFGYIHLRVARDANDKPLAGMESGDFKLETDEYGQLNRVQVRRGTHFRAGDPLGTLNRLNHVHLVAGPPHAEVNPLAVLNLPGLTDTIAPVIEDVALTDEQGKAVTQVSSGKASRRFTVHGRVRILVRAYDQIDGNATYRKLAPFGFGYQILDSSGQPASGFEIPRETIVFDRLPSGPPGAMFVYAEGSQSGYEGKTVFTYLVNNELRDGKEREAFWNASELPSGDYLLRVFVADFFGNSSRRDVPVTITR